MPAETDSEREKGRKIAEREKQRERENQTKSRVVEIATPISLSAELAEFAGGAPPDERSFRFGSLPADSCLQVASTAASAMNSARYPCSFCNYSTIYKDTLIKHERTHTGDKPFRCAICGYAASQRNNVRIHAARKHGTLDCVYDERKVMKTF